jgi:hypothetical protein
MADEPAVIYLQPPGWEFHVRLDVMKWRAYIELGWKVWDGGRILNKEGEPPADAGHHAQKWPYTTNIWHDFCQACDIWEKSQQSSIPLVRFLQIIYPDWDIRVEGWRVDVLYEKDLE